MYDLQQRLLESEAARLLAVRRVAQENQGKDTAGVDGVKSLGPKERLAIRIFTTPEGVQLRTYRQTSLLRGEDFCTTWWQGLHDGHQKQRDQKGKP